MNKINKIISELDSESKVKFGERLQVKERETNLNEHTIGITFDCEECDTYKTIIDEKDKKIKEIEDRCKTYGLRIKEMEETLKSLNRLRENRQEENKGGDDMGEVLQSSVRLLNELREKDREIKKMKETYAVMERQVEHVKRKRKNSKNNSKKNKKNNSNQSESKGSGKSSNVKKSDGRRSKKTIDNNENGSSNSHTETRVVIMQQNGSNCTEELKVNVNYGVTSQSGDRYPNIYKPLSLDTYR